MDRAQKALDAAERQAPKAPSVSNGKHSSHGSAPSRSGSAKVRPQRLHKHIDSRALWKTCFWSQAKICHQQT